VKLDLTGLAVCVICPARTRETIH